MTLPRRVLLATACVCAVSFAARSAWAQFDEMVKHVPGAANVTVLVNAEKVFASEIAKAEDWQAQRGKRFESGMTFVPAKATKVVIASQVDLEVFRPMWDVAILEFTEAPTLDNVMDGFGGIEDKIGDTPALRVADDSYIVRLSDTLLGAFGPGNRQLVANWLSQKDDELSPYLQQALSYVDAGTEVILALDLTHAVTPAMVEQRLAETENADIKKLDAAQVGKILSSVKGVMLGITFGKQAYGKVRVDFGEDATPLAGVAKALLLHVLESHGAMIDELADWKVETKGTTIFLDGDLGESGLMRITSLINLPTHALDKAATGTAQTPPAGAKPQAQSPSDPEQLVLETTKAYFDSIDRIIRDLKSRKGEARTIGQIGTWFNNYANKIDRLPILNVDEEMLQYGQYVTQQLRNCSGSVKGYGIQKRVAEVNVDNAAAPLGGALGDSAAGYYNAGATSGYYGRPLGYGAAYGWTNRQGAANSVYWAGRSEMRQAFAAQTQARTQLRAGMAGQVQGILEELRQVHTQVRTAMTKKYQVEF